MFMCEGVSGWVCVYVCKSEWVGVCVYELCVCLYGFNYEMVCI